ncbi:MAG: type ISP restriction/modification enzyme, partial [Microcystis sp.]
NERPGQTLKLFPNETIENLVIITTGVGSQKDVSVLITNTITDYHFQHNGQCFPLYTHEKQEKTDQTSLFTETEGYTRKENIPNSILIDFQNTYTDRTLTKEDIFYYVYGILHSPEYKTRFAADLKKMLPR